MRILFLSDTDLLRAPMATFLARSHARQMSVDFAEFSSAGLAAVEGARPTAEIVGYMRGQQFDIRAHRASVLSHRLVCEADMVLTMTHDQAREARRWIGNPHQVKVRVLNDLIGFGDHAHEMDLLPPRSLSHGGLLTVYSRIKASTGRLVRNISHGCDSPEHFGIPPIMDDGRSTREANPETRRFLALRVFDLLRRAYEPMTVEAIAEALEDLGHAVSPMMLAELLERELDGRVIRTATGGWEAAATKGEERASTNGGAPPPAPHRADVRFTVEEAFAFLAISESSTIEDAKRAYRKLVSRYHPDKFHDDADFRALAEVKARRMNKAWEIVERAFKVK